MTCSAPHLSFSYLHVPHKHSLTFLHPPAVHPLDGMQAPLKIPPTLTAMLNNLDYTQGCRQNPVFRKNFLGTPCPAFLSGRTFTHLQQSLPPFDSSLEESSPAGGKRAARPAVRMRERRTHAPCEHHLHRVLHQLKLLPAGRQSGGRD